MKTFKEAFCDRFDCPPAHYRRKAVFKCLYPHAFLFFRVFFVLQTRTIVEALNFIEKVGRTRTDEELEDVVSEYHNDVRDTSTYWARQMKMRVSTRLVAKLNHSIRRKQTVQDRPVASAS